MKFEPPPSNDFKQFIESYFSRCRAACPRLLAIAGKWTFEDLIPGLSDFDTRFIASDDTTASDWAEMSLAIGKVHTDLARERPDWARNLEHLPGVNLTLSEITDEDYYYPEFQQWTFYDGNSAALATIRNYLDSIPWTYRDEAFHLRKFAAYFGPYQRGIDPAINIGRWENKYPLHSRYMHYFAPPVQSAVALLRRRAVTGKLESLRAAREILPNPQVIDGILDALERHYEIPDDYQEPRLSEIESELHRYLQDAYATLRDQVSLIEIGEHDDRDAVAAKVKRMPSDPADAFREGVKFARLMKGRLLFYAEPIAWFDSIWLIRNELGRIVANFYEKPLAAYGQIRYGRPVPAREVLDRLRGELITPGDWRDVMEFVRVASTPFNDGLAKERARQVAEVFEPVQRLVEALSHDLAQRARTQRAG